MQYKVPQNVDLEDKVIGPLTIRQFIIILVAVGIIMVLNFILVAPLRMVFYLTSLVVGGVAGIIAFAKYGDQNFEVFLLSAYRTFTTPRKRVWKKEKPKEMKPIKEKPKKTEPKPEPKKGIDEARDDLSKLADIVDSGGYSALNNNGRTSNITSPIINDDDATDILKETATENDRISPLITAAEKSIPKREALVSEAASIDPTKKQKTPKIKLRGEEFK